MPTADQRFLDLKKVLNLYGLRMIEATTCASLYSQNAAFHVETPTCEVLLKPFRGTERKLAEVSRSIQILWHGGYRHMPKWLKTTNGRHYVKYDGQLYYATEWLNGEPIGNKLADFERLGQRLAQFHLMSHQCARGPKGPLVHLAAWLKGQSTRFDRQAARVGESNSAFGRWLKRHGDECKALETSAFAYIQSPGGQRVLSTEDRQKLFIHGDVTRPNIVVLEGSNVQLIDWERLRAGSPLFELSKTLANTTSFQIPCMRELLRGYVSTRPLSRDERLVLTALFKLPREAWYAAAAANHGRRSTMMSRVLQETWQDRLSAINYMDAWARNKEALTLAADTQRRHTST